MSDTPRTDAHTRQLIDILQHPHWIDFARSLERENAALKADKEHLVKQLREANRLLRAFAPESARSAAIDAARKENHE